MKKYGNIKVVTVRQHRECCHCKNDVIEARAILDSTLFDDEGGAYANADFLSESIGKWKQTQKGEDIFLDKRIEILGGSL